MKLNFVPNIYILLPLPPIFTTISLSAHPYFLYLRGTPNYLIVKCNTYLEKWYIVIPY